MTTSLPTEPQAPRARTAAVAREVIGLTLIFLGVVGGVVLAFTFDWRIGAGAVCVFAVLLGVILAMPSDGPEA